MGDWWIGFTPIFEQDFPTFLCSWQFTKVAIEQMENPFQPILEELGSIKLLLQKMQQDRENPPADAPIPRKIMSLAEFCEYAGLSKQTAYKLTSTQKVPHSKRGKRLYFDRDKVDVWLLENQVATHSEIQKKASEYLTKKRPQRRA